MNNTTRHQTLVFIHGSGDTAHVWDALVARLPGLACVSLDLPGRGESQSQPIPEHLSVADYAASVRAELERRGVSDVCLVGHSLGSAIALRLAADAPELVRRVVLVGGGARLRVLPALLEDARERSEQAQRELLDAAFAPEHAAERDALRAQPVKLAPSMLYRDLAACDTFDMMAELGGIAQPTLVVTGEQDQLTPPKYAVYLRDHLPNASLVLIPGAGHYLPVEEPDALADAITRWLEDEKAEV